MSQDSAPDPSSTGDPSAPDPGAYDVGPAPPGVRRDDDPPAFEPFERTDAKFVYDSIWCRLRRDDIRLPNGREQDYHVFQVPNAVVVVPFTADGRLTLIWQYRYPHGRSHWELPAGRIHSGESPAQAAERELREETGLQAERIEPLPGFFPVNGISDHFAHVFAARGCTPHPDGTEHEESERILTRSFEVAEVRERLLAGEYQDGFSALALFYALS